MGIEEKKQTEGSRWRLANMRIYKGWEDDGYTEDRVCTWTFPIRDPGHHVLGG